MNITLRQLRIFLATARQESITIAAERLHLTKPAVSTALAELERRCGRQLFDRRHGRLQLNDDGRQLLPLADELLQRGNAIDSLFGKDADAHGLLRLGASFTIGHQLLPTLIQAFRHETGLLRQQVQIGNSHDICEQIAAFELDLGLIEDEVPQPEIRTMPWTRDRMVVVAAADHPLAGRQLDDLAPLNEQSWLLREPGSGTRNQFLHRLAPQLEGWQAALELNAAEAIINAAAAGLGLTLISELEARHALADGRLARIGIPQAIDRPLRLAWHREKHHNALLTRFVDFCHRHRQRLGLPAGT